MIGHLEDSSAEGCAMSYRLPRRCPVEHRHYQWPPARRPARKRSL